jgi:hypothetical protein
VGSKSSLVPSGSLGSKLSSDSEALYKKSISISFSRAHSASEMYGFELFKKARAGTRAEITTAAFPVELEDACCADHRRYVVGVVNKVFFVSEMIFFLRRCILSGDNALGRIWK